METQIKGTQTMVKWIHKDKTQESQTMVKYILKDKTQEQQTIVKWIHKDKSQAASFQFSSSSIGWYTCPECTEQQPKVIHNQMNY